MTARTLDQVSSVAERVVSALKRSKAASSRAVVLTLSGPLGAGKTAFVQRLAAVLGVSAVVTSPTFVLRSDYSTDDSVFTLLSHIDVYRMEDPDEILTVGWRDLLLRPRTLIAVEWPERVSAHLPEDRYSVSIRFSDADRVFSFSESV